MEHVLGLGLYLDGLVILVLMDILMHLIILALKYCHQMLQECIMIHYSKLHSHALMINVMDVKTYIYLINLGTYMMSKLIVWFAYKVNLLIQLGYVLTQLIPLYGVEMHVLLALITIYHLD